MVELTTSPSVARITPLTVERANARTAAVCAAQTDQCSATTTFTGTQSSV